MQVSARLKQTFYLCVLVGIVCLELWLIRQDTGQRFQKGHVIETVPSSGIPKYVNRWCFVKNDKPLTMTPDIAIVEFGTARRRRLYAFPQPSGAALATNDEVWGNIDSCLITKEVRPTMQSPARLSSTEP
jgi:hypothetical protein